MESFLHPSSEDIRISTSPRRSPQITEGVHSPARSHYPQIQQMDSMHTQPDYGLRTTDFFDYESSDDGSVKVASLHDEAGRDDDLLPRKASQGTRRPSEILDDNLAPRDAMKITSPTRPAKEGYQPLMATVIPEEDNRAAEMSSSSLVGSVDELLPGRTSSPPQFPQRPHKASLRPSSRYSSAGDRTSKLSQTLGAYAIAHEITLQALMRDESALDNSFTQLQTGNRQSILPFSTPAQPDGRSPKPRPVSTGTTSTTAKKVHVVPPPIDTSGVRKSIPDDIVRTPYPFSPEAVAQKDNNRTSAYTIKPISTIESILTVSIRQNNPNSRRRSTNLTIPASSDFSVVRSHSPRSKEQHFKALDFDDEALFRQLQKCYSALMGPMRFLSARSLKRISIAGPAMREVDRAYWIQPLRSPQGLAGKRLSGTFSEERIMSFYHNPDLGKSRYAFVHWAHRLASTTPVRTSRLGLDDTVEMDEEDSRRDMREGLEFVVCWSGVRIGVAFALVLLISISAALLWILLGRVTIPGPHEHGGFRDAGDRVASGVVMGICLLLLGLSGMAGWLGLSWMVM